MNLLATCVFIWNSYERRSNRYGSIILTDTTYNGIRTDLFAIHRDVIQAHLGKRVRLVAEVVEHRPSGHCGDQVLGIYPDPAPTGEKIEVGIGVLVELDLLDGDSQIALRPEDGRSEFWCNPLGFYKLHDQTVNLFVEETTDPEPPVYVANDTSMETSVVAKHEGNMTVLQIKTKSNRSNMRVYPTIEDLGDGLMRVTPPGGPVGSRFPIE